MKINFLNFGILAASAMLLLSSCDKKEEGLNTDNKTRNEFMATIQQCEAEDNIETKTYTDDGRRVLWRVDDRVSILQGRDVNEEFKVKKTFTEGTSAALEKVSGEVISPATFDANIAYYPYYANMEYVGNNTNYAITVNIPSTQTYKENSFGEGALPMVAVTKSKLDYDFEFKNLFGFLKLKLMTKDISYDIVDKIIIRGNNNEKICGEAIVKCSSNGDPTIEFSDNAGTEIVLNCDEKRICTTATDFWIALPPITFTKGITVEIVTLGNPTTKRQSSAPLTINRSKIKPMEELVIKVDMEAELDIPDANFKEYLLENCDMNRDGRLTLSDVEEWNKDKYLRKEFYLDEKHIGSLKGIEYFTALGYLSCYGNQLTSLDLSKNTALGYLSCYGNQLTSLDLSKNTALEYLSCNCNQLASLDLSKNTALGYLSCYYNQLTSLDVSKNTALTYLECYGNQLTTLDLSKNTALGCLYCNCNQLASLDLSKNTALGDLSCYYNQLTSLDVSKNTALGYLSCYGNQLTSLDLSKNTDLTSLYCHDNQLTSLDLSKNTKINYLYCNMPSLKALYLKKGQQIDGITYNRSFKYINNNTEINPIEIKQVKNNELVDLLNGNADVKDFAVNYDVYFMGKLMVKGGVAMTGDETIDGVANTIKAADYVDINAADYGAFFELVNADPVTYRDVTKVNTSNAKDGKFQWKNAGTKLQTPVVAAYVTYTFKTPFSESTVKSNIIVIPEE